MRDVLPDDEELLEVVFENGYLTKKLNLEQIRDSVNQILGLSIWKILISPHQRKIIVL